MAGLHVFPVGGAKPETCPTGGAHGLTLHRPGQLEQRRIMVSLGVKCFFWVFFFWQFSICSSHLQNFRRLLVAHSTEKQCEEIRNPEINWSQPKDLVQDPMWSMRTTNSICKKCSFHQVRSHPHLSRSYIPCSHWWHLLPVSRQTGQKACLASLPSSSGELTASHLLLFQLLRWVPAWLSSCSLAWLAFLTCCFSPSLFSSLSQGAWMSRVLLGANDAIVTL